jgi:hypothetical protein
MNISYGSITGWLSGNWKRLVLIELICLLAITLYLVLTPRFYEADFSIQMPKVQKIGAINGAKNEWTMMISGLDYMRGWQNPLRFPNEFIINCMGSDTNQNRKKFVNANQMRLQNHGDVIQFSLKLEGLETTNRCANLLLNLVWNDLNQTFDNEVQRESKTPNISSVFIAINYAKPALVDLIRMSDSFIKPEIGKNIFLAIILGLFVTVFVARLKVKYRA